MRRSVIMQTIKYTLSVVAVALMTMGLTTLLMISPVKAADKTYTLTLTLPSGYEHDPVASASSGSVASNTCAYVYLDAARKDAETYSANATTVTVEYTVDESAATSTYPQTASVYLYKWNSDASKQVPRGMSVWTLNYEADGVTVTPTLLDAATDLLTYNGFNIYGTGNFGIRAQSGINISKRTDLTSDAGLSGYKLKEYGQLCMGPQGYESSGYNMNCSNGNPKASYKVGTNNNTATEIGHDSTNSYFANSMIFDRSQRAIPDDYYYDEFVKEYHFRPYAKLVEVGSNPEKIITVYGAVVSNKAIDLARRAVVDPAVGTDIQTRLRRMVASVDNNGSTILFFGESIMEGCDGAKATNKHDPTSISPMDAVVSTPIYNGVTDYIKKRYGYGGTGSLNMQCYATGGSSFSYPGPNGAKDEARNLCKNNMPYFLELAKEDYPSGDDANKVRLICIMAGVNDYWYTGLSPFGGYDAAGLVTGVDDYLIDSDGLRVPPDLTLTTEETYCQSVYRTYYGLTKHFPNAKVVVVTPPRAIVGNRVGSDGTGENNNRTTFQSFTGYVNAQKAVANYLKNNGKSVSIIDVYDGWITESNSRFRSYIPDGVHPNQNGYTQITNLIINGLLNGIID